MSDFNNETIKQKSPDPYRRVKYSMGLVLGLDEFEQEQLYFLEKNRLHNRALHGYGTVCGLNVSVRDNQGKTEVVVAPGIAVAPEGQEIRVQVTQCGDIDLWFDRNQDEIKKSISEEGTIKVYVVLCYRECERDRMPVPGIPCRSQEESSVNSRIEDFFELKLSLIPPPKIEEELMRRFGELLGKIKITPDADPEDYQSSIKIEKIVREITDKPHTEKIFISPEMSSLILRNIFRVFVTEVRPKIRKKADGCFSSDGDCVCLARLEMPVFQSNDKISLKGGALAINAGFEDRTFLLNTRVLQEWLLCGKPGMSKVSPRSFATLFTIKPGIIRAWVHYKEQLDISADAVGIKINGKNVAIKEVIRIPGSNVFDISFFSKISKPQYEPSVKIQNSDIYGTFGYKLDSVSRVRVSQDKLNQGTVENGDRITVNFNSKMINETISNNNIFKIIDEMPNPYMERYGKILTAHLIVDLPSLSNLYDVDIPDPKNLETGAVLIWDGTKWVAGEQKEQTKIMRYLPFVTIIPAGKYDEGIFELWFNIDAHENKARITTFTTKGCSVFQETNDPEYMTPIPIASISNPDENRNIYQVKLKNVTRGFLRFVFQLNYIKLNIDGNDMTVLKYATNYGIAFMGYDGDKTVTAFVKNW